MYASIRYHDTVSMNGCLAAKGTDKYLVSIVTEKIVLNIGSIRIYILTTGVVSNETNTYVRMYIEEFILVEIWIHWS